MRTQLNTADYLITGYTISPKFCLWWGISCTGWKYRGQGACFLDNAIFPWNNENPKFSRPNKWWQNSVFSCCYFLVLSHWNMPRSYSFDLPGFGFGLCYHWLSGRASVRSVGVFLISFSLLFFLLSLFSKSFNLSRVKSLFLHECVHMFVLWVLANSASRCGLEGPTCSSNNSTVVRLSSKLVACLINPEMYSVIKWNPVCARVCACILLVLVISWLLIPREISITTNTNEYSVLTVN